METSRRTKMRLFWAIINPTLCIAAGVAAGLVIVLTAKNR